MKMIDVGSLTLDESLKLTIGRLETMSESIQDVSQALQKSLSQKRYVINQQWLKDSLDEIDLSWMKLQLTINTIYQAMKEEGRIADNVSK